MTSTPKRIAPLPPPPGSKINQAKIIDTTLTEPPPPIPTVPSSNYAEQLKDILGNESSNSNHITKPQGGENAGKVSDAEFDAFLSSFEDNQAIK